MLGLKLSHVSKRGPWGCTYLCAVYPFKYGNGNVIFSEASDENFVKMMRFSFQWCTLFFWVLAWLHYWVFFLVNLWAISFCIHESCFDGECYLYSRIPRVGARHFQNGVLGPINFWKMGSRLENWSPKNLMIIFFFHFLYDIIIR